MTWKRRKPLSFARRGELRRVENRKPWQCVLDTCPQDGCDMQTCVCPPCDCAACDKQRKRARFGRIEELRVVKPERREEVQQVLFPNLEV